MGIKELNETHDPYLRSEGWGANKEQQNKLFAALVVASCFCFIGLCFVAEFVVMSFFKWLETL